MLDFDAMSVMNEPVSENVDGEEEDSGTDEEVEWRVMITHMVSLMGLSQ